MIYAFSQTFKPKNSNNLIFEISKESAQIYNWAINLYKQGKTFKELSKTIDKEKNTKYIIAQSVQASYQQYIKNFQAYIKALKEYRKNPKNFSGEPKPPHKEKFLKPIYFKEEAIRRKDNELWLSIKKPFEPIKIKWNEKLPTPKFISICYDCFTGWKINFTLEREEENLIDSKEEKVLTIDLGVKRIATLFDGTNTIILTGKEFLALSKLRNKLLAKTQSKYANNKKESRRRKYLMRAYRKNVRKIKNKEKDILHKYSKFIVDYALENKITKIVFGDNAGTHKNTNKGKENNQKITQNPEQKLRKYVEYKFSSVGGITELIPEYNTSKRCPKCFHIHNSSPKTRVFVCEECGYSFDRDGVGSLNMYFNYKKVSSSPEERLDVIGRMTLPKGWKYKPSSSCASKKLILSFVPLRKVGECQEKETTVL